MIEVTSRVIVSCDYSGDCRQDFRGVAGPVTSVEVFHQEFCQDKERAVREDEISFRSRVDL